MPQHLNSETKLILYCSCMYVCVCVCPIDLVPYDEPIPLCSDLLGSGSGSGSGSSARPGVASDDEDYIIIGTTQCRVDDIQCWINAGAIRCRPDPTEATAATGTDQLDLAGQPVFLTEFHNPAVIAAIVVGCLVVTAFAIMATLLVLQWRQAYHSHQQRRRRGSVGSRSSKGSNLPPGLSKAAQFV